MVRLGQTVAAVCILMLLIPAGKGCALVGLILIGMGCAPVYPSLIHQTPANFGARYSQSVIGLQMASAYVGTTLMPPFFGFLSGKAGLGLYPVYLFVIMILMIVMTEMVHRKNRTGAGS